MGGSLAVQIAANVAIGAGTSALGSVAEQAIVSGSVDASKVGWSALSGGVGAGIGTGIGALWKSVKAGVGNAPKKTIQDAISAQQKNMNRIDKWVKSEKLRREVTTMVSGIDERTGKVVTRIKRDGRAFGKCAEDLVVDGLGGNNPNIKMTKAFGIRGKKGWQEIPVCIRNCQPKYNPSQFVDDITWVSGGVWDDIKW